MPHRVFFFAELKISVDQVLFADLFKHVKFGNPAYPDLVFRNAVDDLAPELMVAGKQVKEIREKLRVVFQLMKGIREPGEVQLSIVSELLFIMFPQINAEAFFTLVRGIQAGSLYRLGYK